MDPNPNKKRKRKITQTNPADKQPTKTTNAAREKLSSPPATPTSPGNPFVSTHPPVTNPNSTDPTPPHDTTPPTHPVAAPSVTFSDRAADVIERREISEDESGVNSREEVSSEPESIPTSAANNPPAIHPQALTALGRLDKGWLLNFLTVVIGFQWGHYAKIAALKAVKNDASKDQIEEALGKHRFMPFFSCCRGKATALKQYENPARNAVKV